MNKNYIITIYFDLKEYNFICMIKFCLFIFLELKIKLLSSLLESSFLVYLKAI